jgi:hypothetical protein
MVKRVLIGLMLVGFALIWIHLSWSATIGTMQRDVSRKSCTVSSQAVQRAGIEAREGAYKAAE